MADLPKGAKFGTLVHAVLETADPFAADLAAELESQIREHSVWWPVDVAPEELAAAMVPLHDTPLGPLAPGVTLRQIGLRDRLREMEFEFPLAGGDLLQRGRVGTHGAVRRQRRRSRWPTSAGCWPSTCLPTTRWRPMPSGCRTARWARSR